MRKRILAAVFVLLLAVSAGNCLAANRHAIELQPFLAAFEYRLSYYELFGTEWDGDNFILLEQQRRVATFDCDGLLLKMELYKDMQTKSNKARLLSAKVPLDTELAPNTARHDTRYRIIALIAALEYDLPDKGSADEQIATLTNVSKLYDAMSEEYSVYIKPQNVSVLLYNGKQYDYFYDYEQSMTPVFFVAKFPQ